MLATVAETAAMEVARALSAVERAVCSVAVAAAFVAIELRARQLAVLELRAAEMPRTRPAQPLLRRPYQGAESRDG